jgi:perosamine synthetase
MLNVPFYRPSIGSEEIEEVVATLRSGWLTTGPRTKQFEAEFGAYMGRAHAVAVNSCTAALHLALEAVGVGRNDGVLVPTMTFAATAEVVRYFGARPVLVDCREDDLNLDVGDAKRRIAVEQAAGRRVVAIIPVHYGGQVGNVEGVRALADEHRLKVIEDAAHCCPAFYWDRYGRGEEAEGVRVSIPEVGQAGADGWGPGGPGCWRPVGSDADISCFSFYANKTITTGEGGMACTDDSEYADRMRIMSLHGISRDAWKRYTGEGSWYYEIIAPGFKYNLTDIAAAIGLHQVRKADLFHRQRSVLAARYLELLAGVEELELPRALPGRIHSWHLFPVRLKAGRARVDRGVLIDELQRRGIGCSVHWMPLHMHPYYRETYGFRSEDYPVAAEMYRGLVTLPLYPGMGEAGVEAVCGAIVDVLRRA